MSLKGKSEDTSYNFNEVILRTQNLSSACDFGKSCLVHFPGQTDVRADVPIWASEDFRWEAKFMNPYFNCEVFVVFWKGTGTELDNFEWRSKKFMYLWNTKYAHVEIFFLK